MHSLFDRLYEARDAAGLAVPIALKIAPDLDAAEIAEIAQRICDAGQPLLITRVDPEVHAAVVKLVPAAEYHPLARAVTLRPGSPAQGRPGVSLMTAGTSDRPVAEEAIVTAEMMGNEVLAYLEIGEHKFLGRVDPRTAARAGQQLQVAFDVDLCCVFDPDTKAAIGLPAASASTGSSST